MNNKAEIRNMRFDIVPRTTWVIMQYMNFAKPEEVVIISEDIDSYVIAFGRTMTDMPKCHCYSSKEEAQNKFMNITEVKKYDRPIQ